MAHVSGKMRSDRRKAVIDSFRDSKLGILTNARCLTEGVDLPAVDMVAFLSRRKSRVDIIQAIGRCLRKPRPNRENKDTGYVLVPLFVKLTPGMALLDAIESAGYDEIWDVLNALADHDDSLEAAVRRESVDRSRYKIPKFSVLRDYVEVISSLGEIRDAVSSKCMEGLQLAWDDYYGRLLAFFDAHNHIKVPNDTLENRELVQWMYEQRSRRSKGLMSEEDVRKLDVVGFVWDKFDAQWNLMYAKAKSFKDANGHFDVPVVDAQSQTLSTWISRQRSKFRSGSLPDLQKGMLDEIGFNWEVLEERWVDSFEQLNSFYSMNGHCRLPAGSEYDALNTWCKNQRQNYRKGKLSADRIAKLEGIKFIWNALDAAWMDFYDHLVAYQKVHSHCNVPEGYNAVPGLSSWVSNNRNKPPRDPERLKLLNDIGFVFSVHDKAWEEMVRRLIAYKDTHGDCAVPAIYPLDPKLGKWVSNVRVKARKGKLSDARNAQLSAIGFAFVVKASPSTYKSWDESFAVLSSYHALTGGVDVPADYSEAPWLPKWIHRQREQKIKGLLTVDQIARLDGIGFIWDVLSAQWDANFALLAEFKSLKNNCRVPHGYPENPALALWVKRQRKAYREGKLSLERIARLNSLNFEWVA
jgi:hypothetical protein